MGWFLRLLQGVPVWLAGLILAAVGLAVSQLCLLVVGRLADVAQRRRSNGLIALVPPVVGVIYAVPLAMQRVLCGLLSLAVTSVVLLIVATDRPFHGVPRVPPDAMREVVENELRAGP